MVEVMDRLRGPFVVRWLASSQADAQGPDRLRGPWSLSAAPRAATKGTRSVFVA